MPLPKPSLDNRRFDQLVAECVALLARRAPQWTDHNASDPGITILELAAWLGEQNIYRFDRISTEALRTFVRLLGIEPRPPGVAQTVVVLRNPGTTGLALPARIRLADDQGPHFETTTELFVSPARLTQLETGPATPRPVVMPNAAGAGQPWPAFGLRPRPGHALYLAFDRPLDWPAARLSLHVWTDHWQEDAQTRVALQAEDAARQAHAGDRCGTVAGWQEHYRVRTIWEFSADQNGWLPLQDVVDETRALTLSGFVHFTAPHGHRPGGPKAQYRVRCRIVAGRFECPPRLVQVALNAVTCEHALSRARRDIGVARGHAGAWFDIGEAPVIAGSTNLHLIAADGQVHTDWREAPDWDQAGAHDRVYRLDPETGEIFGGNGRRGQPLPAGSRLMVRYRSGGGAAGNVAAGTLTRVPLDAENVALAPELANVATPFEVGQAFAANGGTAAETIASAQARAFDAVSAVDKAVTLEDYERLALATPGVPVARVRALANRDPLLPCFPAPGVITVVVVPACPRPAPLPSAAMLDAVARFLDARRLVTSEVRMMAPSYRRVAVQAVLSVAAVADARQVLASATTRLSAYLDPLTGGADGGGWPFGRAVYRGEILALLAGTPGVQRVTELGFVVGPGPDATPFCENVELCPGELIRSGRHRLRIESDVARDLHRSEPHECEFD